MRFRFVVAMALFVVIACGAQAAPPRVLPAGELPKDARLNPPKALDGYFPFKPSSTTDEWNARAENVRRQMLVALGLWPMPTRTPLNPVIHGRIDRPDYTVEKVYFESYPGFFVTGSLYRPKNATGKGPGVLVPHGHHPDGRFNTDTLTTARNHIAEGAERFESGGRYPLQAMCVTLARMGCTAFHYDMVGYADSTQLSLDLIHRFDAEKSTVQGPRAAGFFSVPAELQCQSPMGLQTYNSIRALDFISELSDVDPAHIGVTGASGGGTQTMILAALDPRVTAAVPVVMVSTAMQGGCTCENASLLRIDTGNIEFAALFAPKPQCLIAADDWTKELGTKGLPELKQHYQLVGAPDNIQGKLNIQFPHNYNFVSREAMYQWFNKHLKLDLPSPVLEEDFQPLSTAELSVWDKDHPKPPGGDEFEQSLCKWMADDAAKQLAALQPKDTESLSEYCRVVRGAFEVILGGGLPAKDDLQVTVKEEAQGLGDYLAVPGLLRRKSTGSETPFVMITPDKLDIHQYVLWIDEAGKAGLFADDGQPKAEVRKLLDAGVAVVGVDLFLQGEFLADGKSPVEMRRVANPRKALAYTLGYNYAPFVERVRDILSLAAYLRAEELAADDRLSIVGFDGAGKFVAGALAVSGKTFDRGAVDTAGFRFANLKSVWDIDMLPGAGKYGDVPAMLSLAHTKALWVAGEGSTAPGVLMQAAMFDGPADQKRASATAWLMAQ